MRRTKKDGFLDKVIERLDRLDPESLQTQFMRLVQERGLLETIFQSIQEGVIVIDDAGRMTYANRSAEQLMGFSLEQLQGRPAQKAVPDLDWSRILDMEASDWSKLTTGEIEVTYPEHRYVSFYAVPLAESQDTAQGAVVILRDITRSREDEANLLESERINAVKLLAAGVAHEIGNPLNALTIHLQLLERELRSLPEEHQVPVKELVDIASSEVSRLDLIITQFLKAIRPSAPSLALTDIKELLEQTLVIMRHEIVNRDIEVQLDCPAAVPRIHVDKDQIKQVFYNLIKNAFQAMPVRGRLNIALSQSDHFFAIEFLDNGQGIDPEDLGRIFEPYHTTKRGGSGLGLMIVQRIVQDHGGQIEVESKPDTGTRFTILLPLADRRVRRLGQPSAKKAKEQPGEKADHPSP